MTTFTTTYYAYDKSQRLTKQYGTSEAHYFTFNQRNLMTQIQDVKATSPDANRYFTYNGLRERVLVTDGGTSPPSYFTYDGSTLLTEKDTTGTALGRYRHNHARIPGGASALEMVVSNGASSSIFHPAFDDRGNVRYAFKDESNYISYLYDFFARQLIALGGVRTGTVVSGSRLQAFTGKGLNVLLTASEEFYVTPDGNGYIPNGCGYSSMT